MSSTGATSRSSGYAGAGQGGWENLGMPPVDGVDLTDALAARARWPCGMLTWLMNQAPEVLPDVCMPGSSGPGRSAATGDAVTRLADTDVLRAEVGHSIAVELTS